MALTRRTPRFGELAQAIEAELEENDVTLDPDIVDRILRHRIDSVANKMGLTPRTALTYAPADLPEALVSTVLEAIEALPPTSPRGRPTDRSAERLTSESRRSRTTQPDA